ncbi:MAG: DUF504 domain-containing protein [Methanotrichaceae archaeon]|nr:DUF504 domain-containing protein [Methanotrichaceae archaeon]
MRTSHALLLRLRHDPQFNFSKASVEFVDRGAPGDMSTVQGDKIIGLERGWMEIESEMKTKFIPAHRIRRITYDGATMWEKSNEQKTGTEDGNGV